MANAIGQRVLILFYSDRIRGMSSQAPSLTLSREGESRAIHLKPKNDYWLEGFQAAQSMEEQSCPAQK